VQRMVVSMAGEFSLTTTKQRTNKIPLLLSDTDIQKKKCWDHHGGTLRLSWSTQCWCSKSKTAGPTQEFTLAPWAALLLGRSHSCSQISTSNRSQLGPLPGTTGITLNSFLQLHCMFFTSSEKGLFSEVKVNLLFSGYDHIS
jgi:hypothetical protein